MVADSTDPDLCGFVQWRVAFYIAGESGSVLNFFNLLDDFFVWKAESIAKEIQSLFYGIISETFTL